MRYLVLFLVVLVQTVSAAERPGFHKKPNMAQYKGSDYSNVVHVARGITLAKAFDIAEANPEIAYFFYVKGGSMALELPADVGVGADPFQLLSYVGEKGIGYCRLFEHGDAVFFRKEGMWLGSAPGLADVYIKQ